MNRKLKTVKLNECAKLLLNYNCKLNKTYCILFLKSRPIGTDVLGVKKYAGQ